MLREISVLLINGVIISSFSICLRPGRAGGGDNIPVGGERVFRHLRMK